MQIKWPGGDAVPKAACAAKAVIVRGATGMLVNFAEMNMA
jgi:hypothetical protein